MTNDIDKYLFIHIPKAAGRTISNCLKNVGFQPIPLSPQAGDFPTLQKVESIKSCCDYFKFAFVRNPWDRATSAYEYVLKTRKEGFMQSRSHTPTPLNMTFKQFITNHSELNPETKWHYSYTQHDILLSSKNELSIDFIGRFERLQQDFNLLCEKLGIPHQQLPHINKTEHKHYSEYYNDETRLIIAEKFKKDIEAFGYTF